MHTLIPPELRARLAGKIHHRHVIVALILLLLLILWPALGLVDPLGLAPVPIPADNAPTEAKIALGE
ncbi:MAG: hypothetical protein FIA97_00805 [Methylococcaceae bacterium]|nr:hypothetical protein [Methylococcaceae bacterium]